jgi:hypothetical protein
MPAHLSFETVQIHDLTTQFHSMYTKVSFRHPHLTKSLHSEGANLLSGGRISFLLEVGKNGGGKWGQTRMKTNNERQHKMPWHHKHGYHDLIAAVIRILFTQRWGCGSNDESISQPVTPALQQNILHPLIHASIYRFSNCSCSRHTWVRRFRLFHHETLELSQPNAI